jgi:AAA15 family ATPase/GTPase
MEGNKHLTYFKVENFKCFDTFEMDDIGQFNLIVGDNNVGKTSVLEALLFEEDVSAINGNYQQIIRDRNNFNGDPYFIFEITQFIFNIKSKSNQVNYEIAFGKNEKQTFVLAQKAIKELSPEERGIFESNIFLKGAREQGKVISEDSLTLVWRINNKLIKVIGNSEVGARTLRFPNGKGYFPIIRSSDFYNNDLASFFSFLSSGNKLMKDNLKEDISLLIKDVEEISLSNSIIPNQIIVVLSLQNIPNQIPLSSQGEGGVKFMRILLEMQIFKNERLMIDEIDNGIHYSRMKDFWKAVLISAKRNNVQLFMTTHSQECLKYFKEALEELQQEFPNDNYTDKARHFLLKKNKIGNVIAKKFSFEQFQFALDNGNEIRD